MGGNKYDEETKQTDPTVGDKPAEPADTVKEPPTPEPET